MSTWYLEGDFNNDGYLTHEHILHLPLIVGRDESLAVVAPNSSVSRQHAQIEEFDERSLLITDLDSSNGTFVNRHRISHSTRLEHGDIIHLGNMEMRLIDRRHTHIDSVPANKGLVDTQSMSAIKLTEKFPTGVLELEELIEREQVNAVFHPILGKAGLSTFGYEILGRGAHPRISTSPSELFRIAESVGLEVKLSNLMLRFGITCASRWKVKGVLLLNTHPNELKNPDHLLALLQDMRKQYDDLPLTVQISEQASMDADQLNEFKHTLAKLNIRLAFDDFGIGQARLLEIVSTTPHLVKFDRALIEGIDQADTSRLGLLMQLHEMVSELRIPTLAECISSEGEFRTCTSIGFKFYQGRFFGKPMQAQEMGSGIKI